MTKEELLEIVSSAEKTNEEKATAFIELSHLSHTDDDLSEALKYAAMATVATITPRADACCCIGDVYLELGESPWAKKWYENAIGGVSSYCDYSFYTWIPLLKIAQIYLLTTHFDKAEEYISAAEKLTSQDNPEIIEFKKTLSMLKKEYREPKE